MKLNFSNDKFALGKFQKKNSMTLQLKKGITSIIVLSSGSVQTSVRRVHYRILTDIINLANVAPRLYIHVFWSKLGQLFCLFVYFPMAAVVGSDLVS